MSTNAIGLDSQKATELVNALNPLLASYQIFYMNARGFHWNIKGNAFFELHIKFEELYTDLLLKVDEVAERILTLGARPLHSFADYLEHSFIQPVKDATDAESTVSSVLDAFKRLLLEQRKILSLAQEAGDEGTVGILSGYIGEQEKLVWMYSAYQGRK